MLSTVEGANTVKRSSLAGGDKLGVYLPGF